MKKQIKGNGFFVVLLLLVVVSIYMANGMGKKNTIKYNTSDMVRDIGSGKVKNIEISQNQNTPTGRVDITFNDTSKVYYYSTDVSEVENRLYELSEDPEYKGTFTYITNQVEKTPWWLQASRLASGTFINRCDVYDDERSKRRRRQFKGYEFR